MIKAHTDHLEGTAAAVGMVAAGSSAEYRGGEAREVVGPAQLLPVAGDWIPDEQVAVGPPLEEDAPVAAVEDQPTAAIECRQGGEGGGCRGGDEALEEFGAAGDMVEESEQRRGSVVAAVVAEEVGVGEDSAPQLADE